MGALAAPLAALFVEVMAVVVVALGSAHHAPWVSSLRVCWRLRWPMGSLPVLLFDLGPLVSCMGMAPLPFMGSHTRPSPTPSSGRKPSCPF